MDSTTQMDPPAAGSAATTELQVNGMTCSNCRRHVAAALEEVPGVAGADILLDRGHATVRWRPEAQPDVTALLKSVRDAGYDAQAVTSRDGAVAKREPWWALSGWRRNVLLGIVCTIPLMAGEWIFRVGMEPWFHWVAFALATPVQVIAGSRFYYGAWTQLKSGRSNMDTLVALGSTTAYAYSLWGLFAGKAAHLYFMEAAAIITLVSLGHWLESRASARAASSLRALLNLAPQMARRRHPQSGAETAVPVADLRAGDDIILKPGDRVPTDGDVVAGESAVDESMLTGEALPVDKLPGEKTYAGTVNLDGQLVVRVTATGESTALAHIITAVQRAQSSHANIQRLGDKVASIFVPIVVFIALLTALWWGLRFTEAREISEALVPVFWWVEKLPETALAAAMIHAAAVLIVACPCAMGLATPVAIMAGTNVAAQRGILIRDGVALEKAGRISAVMFDKTGTLTRGKPAVVHSEVFLPTDQSRLALRLASSLARRSNHPISRTVATLFDEDFPFASWQEIRGAGVQAELRLEEPGAVAGTLRLGALQWLRKLGIDTRPGDAASEEWMARGATLLGLSLEQKLIALIALQDTVKPGADRVVAQLKQHGRAVYMITGDNRRTALAIAEQVGIPVENVFAEVLPERKAELVRDLQQQGRRVAFVGDGINDAPALEQSNLGIAVSKASDIASEAADIILLKSEIQAIPEALGLARATLRKIKQNLFWAFFYNTAAIPLAALGFLSPVICAIAMGASDLIVIGNALLLRRWKLPGK